MVGIKYNALADLNGQALAWCNKVNRKVHATTKEIPFEGLQKEGLSSLSGIRYRQNQHQASTKRLPHLLRRQSVLRASGVCRQRCGSRGPRQHVSGILRGEADRFAQDIVPKEGHGCQSPTLQEAHIKTDDGREKCFAGTG